jgi:hypothetical protein
MKLVTWDGNPVLRDHAGNAWLFADGKWRAMDARVICEMDDVESRKMIETLERMIRERERKD